MKSRPRFYSPVSIVVAALLVAGGIASGAWCLSRFLLKVQRTTEKTITVKGVAEKAVVSDLGTLAFFVSCKAPTTAAGYKELNRLDEVVRKELTRLGFSARELVESSICYERQEKTVRIKENGKEISKSEFSHYLFRRTYRIRSARVYNIAEAALKLYDLTAQDIDVSVDSPEYFLSSPEQYKLELVDAASRAGFQRAEAIAATCKASLGVLLNAKQGVIQITRPASEECSGGGVYDTGSIDKIIRMVVTQTFALK